MKIIKVINCDEYDFDEYATRQYAFKEKQFDKAYELIEKFVDEWSKNKKSYGELFDFVEQKLTKAKIDFERIDTLEVFSR